MRREVCPCRVAAANARACLFWPQDVSVCYPQLTVDLSAWWSKVMWGDHLLVSHACVTYPLCRRVRDACQLSAPSADDSVLWSMQAPDGASAPAGPGPTGGTKTLGLGTATPPLPPPTARARTALNLFEPPDTGEARHRWLADTLTLDPEAGAASERRRLDGERLRREAEARRRAIAEREARRDMLFAKCAPPQQAVPAWDTRQPQRGTSPARSLDGF